MSTAAPRRVRVWRTPVLLGIVSAVGLFSALLSDGPGDVVAWLTLAVPVLVVAWCAAPGVQHAYFRTGTGR